MIPSSPLSSLFYSFPRSFTPLLCPPSFTRSSVLPLLLYFVLLRLFEFSVQLSVLQLPYFYILSFPCKKYQPITSSTINLITLKFIVIVIADIILAPRLSFSSSLVTQQTMMSVLSEVKEDHTLMIQSYDYVQK